MIYDCFTFFNELELLELRLNELAPVVDRFVLVEATKTHSGKPKPLYYRDHQARFSRFQSQIIHVIVDDLPVSDDAWVLENFQRNCIARGLTSCRPDDFILVSDLDELPRASVVKRMTGEIPFRNNFFANAVHGFLNSRAFKNIFHRRGFRRRLRKNHPFIWRFHQVWYVHYLNCRLKDNETWHGTRMLRFRDFSSANEVRHSGYKIVPDAGWHFSWMGGVQRIREKLGAYAHQEHNIAQKSDAAYINQAMEEGRVFNEQHRQLEFIPLDDSYPRYILENPDKFSGWIRPV